MVSKAGLNYDTCMPISINQPTPHTPSLPAPALCALARLLGRQAAVHVHKYRFEGLGRITLIRLKQEAYQSLNL